MAQSEALEHVKKLYRGLVPPGEMPSVEDFRKRYDDLCGSAPVPDDAVIDQIDADGVPGLLVRAPGTRTDHIVVFLHSGGYMLGSAYGYREFGYRLSAATNASVLLVDYRRSPEHAFPAAVDDSATAVRWAMRHADPARTIVAGDSAGGALVVSALIALRDNSDTRPAAAVSISPMLDLLAEGETMTTKAAEDPVVTRDLVLGMAEAYLQGTDPRSHPLASPLRADLSGLPPLLVMVGSAETLLDDSRRLADRIAQAGGEVQLEVAEDMVHVWPLFSWILPEGRDALDRIGKWVSQHTG